MNISIITVSNSEIISNEKNDSIKLISSQLYKNGFQVVSSQIIKSKSDIVANSFKQALENSDCVIFISDNEFEKCYMCKKVICDELKTKLVVNNFAKKNIEDFSKLQNVPLKKEDSSYCQLPEISRCIKNPSSAFQGFLLEKDSKVVFFLPLSYSELYHMFFASVLPYLLQKANGKTNSAYVFKTFGIKNSEINLLLKDLIKNKHNIEVVCNEYLLGGEVLVNVPTSTKKDIVDNFIQTLYNKILPYIYADTDSSYPELIQSFLNINNRKLVFAEDFTCGRLTSIFYEKLLNAKDFLIEGYFTPTQQSKMKILGVDSKIYKKSTIDDEEVAYQMALGALENSGADVVVSNCGDLQSGDLVFAIGSSEGIHIYRQKVFGTYEQKIVMATNAIFFKLVKKLKKNDFHLGQFTV